MGLWVPSPQWNYYESNLAAISSTTIGTSVAASATPNTKGAWIQLIASTLQDCYWIVVEGSNSTTAATNVRGLLDIGIGAAAAEVVLIPDLLMGYCHSGVSGFSRFYAFPLYVAAGTRISARFANATASKTIGVSVHLYGGPERPGDVWAGSQVDAYGITAASSQGVAVTPGVSGAFGTVTQIVAATTRQHAGLVLGVQPAGQTAAAAQIYNISVMLGAATEVEIAANRQAAIDSTPRCVGPLPYDFISRAIASGERLSVKASQHSTTAQPIDVALYGVS